MKRAVRDQSEISSDAIKAFYKCLDCCDQILVGIGFTGSDFYGVRGATVSVGWPEWTPNPTFDDGMGGTTNYPAGYMPVGDPTVGMGLYNKDLPISPTPDYTHADPESYQVVENTGNGFSHRMDLDNFYYTEAYYEDGVGVEYVPQDLSDTLLFTGASIYFISLDTVAAKFPSDVELLDVQLQVTGPTDLVMEKSVQDSILQYDAAGIDYGPVFFYDTSVDTTETEVEVSFSLVGQLNTDDYVSLGTFKDVSPGTIEAGVTKIISAKAMFQQILNLRNSQYKNIGVFVSTSEGLITPSTFHNVDNSYLANLIRSVWTGFVDIELTGDNGASQSALGAGFLSDKEWYLTTTVHKFSHSLPWVFGDMYVQFRLPSGVVDSLRIYFGGNPPHMTEVS